MSFQSFPTNFPQTMPVVDPSSGHLTKDARLLLTTMWQRTGSGNGIPTQVIQALTATGTSQAEALKLTADWNDVENVSAGSGVVMPVMRPGNDITVRNSSANPLNVYPFTGAQINNLAVGAPFVLAAGAEMDFRCWSTTLVRTT